MRNIKILKDEYWWAADVSMGIHMPLDAKSQITIDLGGDESQNPKNPFLLSSKGRYIWDELPFCAEFDCGTISFDREVELCDGYENLKGAYLAAMKSHFPFNGKIPPKEFFLHPQYNTWIELMHMQTEENIIKYAECILNNGFKPGILMIDDGWMSDYGDWRFSAERFDDPAEMCKKLKEMGFKVMLWVCPFVSADSANFRTLEKEGGLLIGADGRPAIRWWWNGYSAVLDMTNPKACEWFKNELDRLVNDYGVDGFKFDAADPYMYRTDDKSYVPAKTIMDQTEAYCRFAMQYEYNELRAGYKCGGRPFVMRLADKAHSWDKKGLNTLLPNSIIQGLSGYAYHCPDMVGGGELGSFLEISGNFDNELFVRYAQASALMPMMQISASPWCVLDKEHSDMVKEAMNLHDKFGELILSLAENAAQTGEPIIRHMAYEFPDCKMEEVSDQFMLGSDILVAPVLKKGVRKRYVKLPEGSWQTADGTVYTQSGEIPAPLESLLWLKKI